MIYACDADIMQTNMMMHNGYTWTPIYISNFVQTNEP